MKAEFKIFKKGRTDKKVTIVSKEGELFTKSKKILKYKSLGYDVFDLNDNKI